MKRNYFTFIILLSFGLSYSQQKSVNLIISIDDMLPTTNLVITKIEYVDKQGNKYSLAGKATYYPGNTIFSNEGFYKLTSNKIKKIYLYIHYWYECGINTKNYNYVVELNPALLKKTYLILYIYNLDKRKYRRIYFPISKNRNYTYYFKYPSPYQGRLVQKRLTREQRRCH